MKIGILALLAASALALWLPKAAFSAEEPAHPNSIDWQRVALEEKLQTKISQAIQAGAFSDHFIVNVAVEMKRKLDNALKQKARERLPIGKLDLDAPFDDSSSEPEVSLFDSIQQVKASIYLDQSVPDAKVKLVKEIAEKLLTSIGETPATVEVQKTDLTSPPPKTPTLSQTSLLDLAKDFKTPISLAIVALIICIFVTALGAVLFVGYRQLEVRRIALMEAKDAREESQQKQQEAIARQNLLAASQMGTAGGSGADPEEEDPSAESGFERFKLILGQSPEKAASLIKQWVRNPSPIAAQTLCALPQALKTEELQTVFKQLSSQDRREWSKNLGKVVNPQVRRAANQFISSQIVETLLNPSPEMDGAAKLVFDQVKISDAIEVANLQAELGAVLINLMPTAQASRVFSLLPPDLANEITLISLKLSDEQITRRIPKLKETLQQIQTRTPQIPFISRARDLIREAGPEKESAIFNAIAESGDFTALEAAARQFFPSELISQLPPRTLKDLLDALPTDKKADLIFSRPDADRSSLLEVAGRTGTKARELLDFEIQQLQNDEVRVKRVQKNSGMLWAQFTETCRNVIKTNPDVAEQAELVLSDWLSTKSNGQLGGSMGGARAA